MPQKLPTLAELHHAPDEAFKNDELNRLLSQPVHKDWIRKHPIIKVKNEFNQFVPLEYIPVDKIEFLLTKIFQKWRREIKSVQVCFHSIAVTVRLHVLNPISGEWEYNDGVGAVAVQTDQGASAADLDKIKANAVQIALPAAASYAFKDAAECFGTIFGKDLNKRNTAEFQGSYSPEEPLSPVQQAMAKQPAQVIHPDPVAQNQVKYPPEQTGPAEYAPIQQPLSQNFPQPQQAAPMHPSFGPPPGRFEQPERSTHQFQQPQPASAQGQFAPQQQWPAQTQQPNPYEL